MNEQTILFDLDDTLVHCNKYFFRIIEQLAEDLAERFPHFCTSDEVKEKQLELDLASVHINGFTTEHFPESFVDTYRYFCRKAGTNPEADMEEQYRQLAKSVYDMPIEPYPSMIETLEALQKDGHELVLYTGGVEEVQLRKVHQLGLEAFFADRIHVASHKNSQFLNRIIEQEKWLRSRTWMVGNSLRTDIVPALENGIHAVFIPAEQEWQYNVVDVQATPSGVFETVSSLSAVPGLIRAFASV
ncbi:HAD family hydrolase [Xylanibacillus composti]|nr:HAD family hydrolase [Xylanibacillus composti]